MQHHLLDDKKYISLQSAHQCANDYILAAVFQWQFLCNPLLEVQLLQRKVNAVTPGKMLHSHKHSTWQHK